MSLFNLKTSVGELSRSSYARMNYDQVSASRDIAGANFTRGTINFKWSSNGTKWWIPNKSYIRMRCSLTKFNGAPLTLSDNIAPAMNLVSSLFTSAEFRINDKTVSRIGDYLPQIDTLENRMNKSKAYLDGIGETTALWNPDFRVRQNAVCADGVNGLSTTVDRLNLGYNPATTIAITAATSRLVFAAGTPPDAATVWKAGDKIQIEFAADNIVTYTVSNVVNATTIVLNNIPVIADVAAAVVGFKRIRQDSDRNISNIELSWQCPLSIFKVDHALPTGRYELILNPLTATTYQKAAIESLYADKDPAVDFKFVVNDMYLYNATVDGKRTDDISYLLDLTQTRCQSTEIRTAGFSQKPFDVSPSTFALSVAYQDTRVSETTYLQTKFKSYNAAGNAAQELGLRRFYINYAGEQKPSPDADPNFSPGTDYIIQKYVETLFNNGAYYDSGSAESLADWQKRGAYYYFNWVRDGTDNSTRVTVNNEFVSTGDLASTKVLLFDHSKQYIRVTIQNGNVTSA